jgi:hypothetical protein
MGQTDFIRKLVKLEGETIKVVLSTRMEAESAQAGETLDRMASVIGVLQYYRGDTYYVESGGSVIKFSTLDIDAIKEGKNTPSTIFISWLDD